LLVEVKLDESKYKKIILLASSYVSKAASDAELKKPTMRTAESSDLLTCLAISSTAISLDAEPRSEFM